MKPLLAYTIEDTSSLKFPCFASAKLDGIRCLIIDGVVMSRSLKPIRNKHVQALFGKYELNNLDGELVVGPPNAPEVYRTTNSGVMSEDGEPDVKLYLFDRFDLPTLDFKSRFERISRNLPHTVVLDQHYIGCEKTLLEFEEKMLNKGYEGIMVRSPSGIYKFGRSTLRDAILGKLKRMASSEAVIVDMVELMRNNNDAKTNELGYTERSTSKENLVAGGVMGTLCVKDIVDGVEFEIGTGFTSEDRIDFWNNRESYIGKIVTYNHFPVGRKDKPRHPSYKGFREKDDM